MAEGYSLAQKIELQQEKLGVTRYQLEIDGSKNIIKNFGAGIFIEEKGSVSIEVGYALENIVNAYLTKNIQPSNAMGAYCS